MHVYFSNYNSNVQNGCFQRYLFLFLFELVGCSDLSFRNSLINIVLPLLYTGERQIYSVTKDMQMMNQPMQKQLDMPEKRDMPI